MALSAIDSFDYTRDWTKPADFPTFEDDEPTVRADMQFQPNELKNFINTALVSFLNNELIPLVNALVAGTIPPDSIYTDALQNKSVTLEKLADEITAAALGAPSKVNGVAPGGDGNIQIKGTDIPVSASDSTSVSGALGLKQPATQLLPEGTDFSQQDLIPFYNATQGARAMTWAKITSAIYLYVSSRLRASPLGLAHGGTGAATAAAARTNLGALSSAAGAVGASNLAADAVKLTFTNTAVAASAFTSDTTYADFPFRASVSLAGVTETMVPEVFFDVPEAMSGNFAPVAKTFLGGIYLYAAEVPSADITIPTILCWR